MNRYDLDYPDIKSLKCESRLRDYITSVNQAILAPERLHVNFSPAYRAMLDGSGASFQVDVVGSLPVLVCRTTYERFQADGLMILLDISDLAFTPLPVVLANARYLKDDRSAYVVMLRHESVHVEQVIRGDYFLFISTQERRAISEDPTGNLLCKRVLGGMQPEITAFAARRLLQDIYNEGEAYSREEFDFGHRVNFWAAWTDVLMRAADYYMRYAVWTEHQEFGLWIAQLEPEVRAVMLRSNLYKTRYVAGDRIGFLDVLRQGSLTGNTICFPSPSKQTQDVLVRVPPSFLPPPTP